MIIVIHYKTLVEFFYEILSLTKVHQIDTDVFSSSYKDPNVVILSHYILTTIDRRLSLLFYRFLGQ